MQPACATILGVHAVAQSLVVNVEGGNDDNKGGNSSKSLQILESQLPVCFVKQLVVAHVPSLGLHGSRRPSLKFVALDDCCASMLSHAHGIRSWGGGNNATYSTCGEVCGSASGEFVAIIILSKKLVDMRHETMLTTCVLETWVVGHVLENYTCLSSGRNLYDADFGVSHGHQTVLVGECESPCDIE